MNKFEQLLKNRNLSMKYISKSYKIPYRTVQNWKLGERKCPEYTYEMIKDRENLIKILNDLLKDCNTEINSEEFKHADAYTRGMKAGMKIAFTETLHLINK